MPKRETQQRSFIFLRYKKSGLDVKDLLQEWLGIRNVMSALFYYACNVSSKRSHSKDIEVCVLSAIIGFPMFDSDVSIILYMHSQLQY